MPAWIEFLVAIQWKCRLLLDTKQPKLGQSSTPLNNLEVYSRANLIDIEGETDWCGQTGDNPSFVLLLMLFDNIHIGILCL